MAFPMPTKYNIYLHEKGRLIDLIILLFSKKIFDSDMVESSEGIWLEKDGRRSILIFCLIIQKMLRIISKPLRLGGLAVEFLLNLLAENGGFIGLIRNIFTGKMVNPNRESASFRSIIAHIDSRIEFNSRSLPNPINVESKELLYLCMLASKAAYENQAYINHAVTRQWKMQFVEFFNCWNEFLKIKTTQAFIFSDKPKNARLIVVAFRGTEPFNAYDLSTDVDLSWFSMGNMGRVHLGFMKALGLQNQKDYELGWPREHKEDEEKPLAYYSIREKLKKLIKNNRDAKFILTGHSLGGALAILFPSLLILHEQDFLLEKLLGVYTFGQPRVGDNDFGTFMDIYMKRNSKKYFRMVYRYDLIPRVPFDHPFKHFGECMYYSNWYTWKVVGEEPDENYFSMKYFASKHSNALLDLLRALFIWIIEGEDFKESFTSLLLRIFGLLTPGLASHSPRDYLNSCILGQTITTS